MEGLSFLVCKSRNAPPLQRASEYASACVHIVADHRDVSVAIPFIADKLCDIRSRPVRFCVDVGCPDKSDFFCRIPIPDAALFVAFYARSLMIGPGRFGGLFEALHHKFRKVEKTIAFADGQNARIVRIGIVPGHHNIDLLCSGNQSFYDFQVQRCEGIESNDPYVGSDDQLGLSQDPRKEPDEVFRIGEPFQICNGILIRVIDPADIGKFAFQIAVGFSGRLLQIRRNDAIAFHFGNELIHIRHERASSLHGLIDIQTALICKFIDQKIQKHLTSVLVDKLRFFDRLLPDDFASEGRKIRHYNIKERRAAVLPAEVLQHISLHLNRCLIGNDDDGFPIRTYMIEHELFSVAGFPCIVYIQHDKISDRRVIGLLGSTAVLSFPEADVHVFSSCS